MSTLAIGFFDGVHLGHQAILRGADAALTFRRHPLTVLAPERAPRLIMTPEERVAAIRACGVKDVTVLEFTRELAEMSAEEFAREYFLPADGRKAVRRLVCGENWRFGRGGLGDANFLRQRGLEVEIVPYAAYRGEPISSSRIRAALERGEVEDANAMLGRRFRVSGLRFQGKGIGTGIGYPTVNLKPESLNLRLPLGVYEVEIEELKGIANYGLAPTMGDRAWREPVLEIHILQPSPSLLVFTSDSISVAFVRFIRPERKFDSVTDLQRQIAADCDAALYGRCSQRQPCPL